MYILFLIKHLFIFMIKLIIIFPFLMFILIILVALLLGILKFCAMVNKKISKSRYRKIVSDDTKKDPYFTIGILHPFCNSGGGGERVLWSAVKALQEK